MSFISQTSLSEDSTIREVPCDPSVYVGAWVYMSSGVAFNGSAAAKSTSNILGVVESKTSSTVCVVRFIALSTEIFVGLDETEEYYLSSSIPGGMSTLPPTGPGTIVLKLGQPFNSTQFVVNKGIRIKRAS